MTDITATELEVVDAPWGRQLKLSNVAFEEGMSFLRIRIREGKRFTDLDLDPATAEHLGKAFLAWAEANG